MEALFLFGKLRSNPDLLGDVPRNLGSADNRACLVVDWRHGERNGHERAAFCFSNGLIVINPLAVPDALENPRHLLNSIRSSDDGNRLADDLLCGIAEHTLCAPIPTRH